MKNARQRLDALLVEKGIVENRSRAQGLIMAGLVRVGGEVVTKSGTRIGCDEELSLASVNSYVSRAGEKLDWALDRFGIEVTDRDCLDAGASTGGFTDVLLQRGAGRVISADVGYGQLDWSLRNDPRVTVLERTNVRYLSDKDLSFPPDLLVADLSFISLGVALESLVSTTHSIQELVLLVKPQFEAGPEQVGRGGLVREIEVHAEVIQSVADYFLAKDFGAADVVRAPVAGRRAGNREYPLHFLRGNSASLDTRRIQEVVAGG